MNLGQLIRNSASWLQGVADEDGMVVSSRARLARNIGALPFPHKASDAERDRVISQVLDAARTSTWLEDATFLPMEGLEQNAQRALVERHLISPALAEGSGPRGVLFARDESMGAMINEEDHLRLQALVSGFQAEEAGKRVNALIDAMGRHLDYAFDRQWGYLTACPTNTGTGLRLSVLVHLPALVLCDEMERVLRGLNQMAFCVRGFHGEGTRAVGNLFQVSNQATLGYSDGDLVDGLIRITQKLLGFERDAQSDLMREAASQVEDKVWRAYGLLSNARVLSSQEFMNLLSAVRLGRSLRLIDSVPSSFMNRLMITTQSAHLQAEHGSVLQSGERDVLRARSVRRQMAGLASREGGG